MRNLILIYIRTAMLVLCNAIALSAIALSATAPAHGAIVVSGTATPCQEAVDIYGPVVPTPGTWIYAFHLSRPAVGAFIVRGLLVYNFFETGTDIYWGGDTVPIEPLINYDVPVDHGSLDITLPAPYTRDYGGFYEKGFSMSAGAILMLVDVGTEPVGYTIIVRLASAVPEPATWAAMLTGIFLVCAAMRRRRAMGCAGALMLGACSGLRYSAATIGREG